MKTTDHELNYRASNCMRSFAIRAFRGLPLGVMSNGRWQTEREALFLPTGKYSEWDFEVLLRIEEPENQLYPELLAELAEEFRNYTEVGSQVFISTHSLERNIQEI